MGMGFVIAMTIYSAVAGEVPENAFPHQHQNWWDLLIIFGSVFAAAALVAWLVALLLNRMFPKTGVLVQFLTAILAPILVILTIIVSINIGVDGANFADQVDFFAEMSGEAMLLLAGVLGIGIFVAYITIGRQRRREVVRRKEDLKVFK